MIDEDGNDDNDVMDNFDEDGDDDNDAMDNFDEGGDDDNDAVDNFENKHTWLCQSRLWPARRGGTCKKVLW